MRGLRSPGKARLCTRCDARPRRFASAFQHEPILAGSNKSILEHHDILLLFIYKRRLWRCDECKGILWQDSRDIVTRYWTMEKLYVCVRNEVRRDNGAAYLNARALPRSRLRIERHRPT